MKNNLFSYATSELSQDAFICWLCSFALPEDVAVYLDVSLKRFDTVFPAAGSDNSAIELTCQELERCSSNFQQWVDVCKAWQPALS